MSLHGWIILDKPLGITSAHGVAKVKRLMRAAGLKKPKVGHGGTLDPLATGVLPIALGEATKLTGRMLNGDKSYDFTIAFGTATETDDAEGSVTATSSARPTLAEIAAVLPRFTGSIEQRPPAYSALKVDGERAYKRARAGETVELAMRAVTVHDLRVVEAPSLPPLPSPLRNQRPIGAEARGGTVDDDAGAVGPCLRRGDDGFVREHGGAAGRSSSFGVGAGAAASLSSTSPSSSSSSSSSSPLRRQGLGAEARGVVTNCGSGAVDPCLRRGDDGLQAGGVLDSITLSARVTKGTYIRSLARDIAEALGTVGHVAMLRRTVCGPFPLETAITLDNLEDAAKTRGLGSVLLPMTAGLDDIPALPVTPEEADRLKHGQGLFGRPEPDGSYIAMDEDTPIALISLNAGEGRIDRGFNF